MTPSHSNPTSRPPSESSPVLVARDVRKEYPGGSVALAGVDLEVEAGETVALVGESGSGKTTLLRLFNRMVEPTEGSVRVEGRDIADEDPVKLRRGLGYVQQEGGLLPHWTVAANVELVPRLLGQGEDERRRRAREALEAVALDPDRFSDRYPRELSGGQRQRAAIARALAADPPILLLDEPLGALDALTRRDLQEWLLERNREMGKTILLVTHDLEEAFLLADRVGVMKDGRLLALADPEALEREPGDEYVARLLERGLGGVRDGGEGGGG